MSFRGRRQGIGHYPRFWITGRAFTNSLRLIVRCRFRLQRRSSVASAGITANDVQRLLDSSVIIDPAGGRDYAFLVMVAPRACDAGACSWTASTGVPRIVLRVNASRDDEVPLPADVGEELRAYRCQARSLERRAATCKCGRARRCGIFNLSVAADDTFVIRPTGAKLWAIIR